MTSQTLAEQVVFYARQRQILIATAESLTGGMVSQQLCSVAGASSVYRGGIVSYATDLKAKLLGVDEQLLKREGAVHPEVAQSMAFGAAQVCGADYALATTGVAGPEPLDGQPVGRVFLGLCTPEGNFAQGKMYQGTRDEIRKSACQDALELLLGYVK
ncbi:CinA family protein [Rothia sp. P13129]|uniref:CinA family protein n=1 Tax=Rothia sp. P13129 TaxID=3402664 RepID=UPI003AD5D192